DATRLVTGGESMELVRLRAVACLEEACVAAQGGPVVAVTHGGVLGQLLRHADIGTHARHTPTNACISRFLVRPGRQWDILSWAAADHLSGDCAPVAAKYD
ncbi:unnamed protein product, partial [Polarella glacialis]